MSRRLISTLNSLVFLLVVLNWTPGIALDGGIDRTISDPDMDCEFHLSPGKISITIPATNHDLCPGRGMNAPSVLRNISGDFTAQVKVTSDFKPGTTSTGNGRPFIGAGILIWVNEDQFVRIERNCILVGNLPVCYPPLMEYWRNGQYAGANESTTEATYFKGRSTWLRAERKGKTITVSISHDGEDWIEVKTFPVDLPDELSVGVAALNTSDAPFSVDFEELKIVSKHEKAPDDAPKRRGI